MGKASGFILLIAALSSAQVADFTIKGHTLGESLKDFLVKANRPEAVEQCQTFLAQKHPKGAVFGPKYRDPSLEIKRCQGVIAASTGSRSYFHAPGIGYVQFNQRILVAVKVEFLNSLTAMDQQVTYSTVLEDATKKYGVPTEQGTTAWQNGFGVGIYPHYAKWTRADVVVDLRELPEPKEAGYQADIDLVVMTRSEAEAMQKDKAQMDSSRPSVLDDK